MKTKILPSVLILFSGLAYGQTVYVSGLSAVSVNDTEIYWANWDFSPDEGEFNWWAYGGDVVYPDPNWWSSTSCQVNWTAGGPGSVWYSYSTWDNWWEESLEVYVSSPTPVPDAPILNVVGNITSNSFTVTWSSVASATSYQLDVSPYNTFSTFASGYDNLTVNGTSQSVTGLSGGTTYYCRVRAVNESGRSVDSGTESALTIPDVPTAYNAGSITSNSFTASWSNVTGVDDYLVDVWTETTSIYSNLPVSAQNVTVTGLSGGTIFYYRVRARNASGTSGYSITKEVLTWPDAPVNIQASNITANSFTANWGSVTSATSYRLDVSPYSSFSSFVPGYSNLTVNATSQSVTGLSAGTTYYYRVRAVNASGVSGDAGSEVLTIPAAPTVYNASNITASSFTANWSSETGTADYLVDIWTETTSVHSDLAVSAPTLAVTGLLAGTVYYYRVRARNVNGTSGYSDTKEVLTLPDAPTGIYGNNVTASSFTANWSAVTSATHYLVDVWTETTSVYSDLLISGTSLTVTGLSAGATYSYRIRALNATGASAYSSSTDQLLLPDAPVASAATSITAHAFTANWGSVASATSYRLDVWAGDDPGNYLAGYSDLPVTGTTKIVSELTLEKTYYYRVRAINATGASANSGDIAVELKPNQNYIRTIEVLAKGTTTLAQVEALVQNGHVAQYSFFDGLGRPMKNIIRGGSPVGNDIVQPIVYDQFGREQRKYLPFVANGWFDENAATAYESAVLDFYDNTGDDIADDAKPWAETVFEPSPLNRVLKQGAPGAAWQPDSGPYATATDHSVKHAFEANVAYEVLLWTYTSPTPTFHLGLVDAGTSASPTYYNANELRRSLSKDENQHEIVEFKDKQDRIVLKKAQGPDNTWAMTYYIYDDFGQLVCVIPPEAVSRLASEYYYAGSTNETKKTFLERWAFRYRYDRRKRMIIKQLPGADSVVMVYDERDRLVFTQDGNQRKTNQWLFTKYDGLNRPVMTGLYTHGTNIDSKVMAGLLSTTTISEVYDGTTSNYGYSNAVFPTVNCEVLTVNYYDDYDFKSLIGASASNFSYANGEIEEVPASQGQDELPGQDEFAFERVRGQVTGSQTRILNSSTFLWTANYYDDNYRLIQTIASNHKGGFGRVTNVYDFVGKVLRTKTRYAIPPNPDREIYQRFSYDHAGRLLDTWHRIEGGPEVLISSNEYNEIGQLVTKKMHYDNSAAEYLQTVDYRYNIRGWLENINDPSDAIAKDLFNMALKYNSPTSKGGAAQFNGNISEAIWKSAGLDKQSYGYDYDPMNRMTKASYYNIADPTRDGYYDERIGDPSESDPTRSIAYDLNGNIQNLLRKGKKDAGDYDVMDKLHYDYGSGAGNQLMFVSDDVAPAPHEEGFVEIVDGSTDYAYDKNGNLIKDENKGITGIEYNHLNLPWKVSKSAAEYLIYTYDATGRKLAQEVFGTTPKTTEYIGELVFEGNVLQFILHDEGRIVADTEPVAPDPWEYQYFLKDHLGNTRVVFSEKTASEAYTATMEDAAANDEMAEFAHYPTVRSSLPEFDHTDQGSVYTKSMMLHGGQNSQIGLAKSFDVNPGDVFDLEVYAKYEAPTTNPSDIDALFSQVVSAFSLGANTTPLDGAAAYSAFENVFQGGNPWINSTMWEEAPPKAYLNYLLFDENFVLVDFGFDQVSAVGEQEIPDPTPVPHDHLSLHVKVKQKGYLYVYLSNEQPVAVTNVYFDDMRIVHYSGVKQVSDYYPFGLTFNSLSMEDEVPQDLLYQGKEWQKDLDLNLYDFVWRQYDPLTARTTGADPHAESYQPMSPYSWVKNNPLGMIDPDGRDAVTYYGKEAVEYIQDLQNQAIAAEQNSEAQSSKFSFSKGFASYKHQQRSEDTDPAQHGGADPDLSSDARSWQYVPVGPGGTYQATGVSGLYYDYITTYTDGKGKIHIDYVRYKFNTLYFEFPRVRDDGSVIGAMDAAQFSAAAKDLAEEQIEMLLGGQPRPPTATLENNFLTELRAMLAPFGARVSFTPNYGPVPVNPYTKTLWGNGR